MMKNLLIKISISKTISDLNDLDLLFVEGNLNRYFNGLLHSLVTLKSQQNPGFSGSVEIFEQVRSIEEAIAREDGEDVRRRTLILLSLLNEAYESVSVVSKKIPRRWSVSAAILLVCIFAAFAFKPLQKKYISESIQADLLKNEQKYAEQTLSDLFNLNRALQHYFQVNKKYPPTSSTWYGLYSPFGESKTDWIPGLAPKYISTLPHDPRKYRKPIEQYLYQSDGKEFKLIAHFPAGINAAISKYPELVDPKRPSWAIGYWSEGAKTW